MEGSRDLDEAPAAPVGVTPYDCSAVHGKWSPNGTKIVCTASALDGTESGVAIIDVSRLTAR